MKGKNFVFGEDELYALALYGDRMMHLENVLEIDKKRLSLRSYRDEKFNEIFDAYYNPTGKRLRGQAEVASILDLSVNTIRSYMCKANRSILQDQLEKLADTTRKTKLEDIARVYERELKIDEIVEGFKSIGLTWKDISDAVDGLTRRDQVAPALEKMMQKVGHLDVAV